MIKAASTGETARRPDHAPERAAATGRLLSLDVFRGLTIAAMILVNNPGSHARVYWLLRHADWNGCMPADLIFPSFLFIVGVSISFVLSARMEAGDPRRELLAKVVRRTRILFGLGLLLNALPFFDWDILRIPGVLQRIALCYFFASVIVLRTDARGQAAWGAALLLAYWALMTWVPVPGYGAGALLPEHNLAAYVDRMLMGNHLGDRTWDPEGLLGTLPAIGTTLCGVLAGDWIRLHRRDDERLVGLLVGGLGAIAVGLLIGLWFPINKSLWTSSFALFSAGIASIAFAACYWVTEVRGYRAWAKPLVIYGTNPILAYWLSSVVAKLLAWIRVPAANGSEIMLRTAIFHNVFRPLGTPGFASFLFALAYTLMWLAVLTVLYRRKIFVKI